MLFFLKTGGQESFLPTLFNLSQAWNKEREKPIAHRQEPLSPLRIVLVKAFLSEMAARITKVTEDPEVRKKVIAAGWATQEADQTLAWHFQMYDAEKKQEHVDQSKSPLPHARIMQLLEGVAESFRPEVVQRFHATRPQAESYQGPVVVFMMEVAHRGEYAKVLYRNVADLAHNMVWNLMASRMRLENDWPVAPCQSHCAAACRSVRALRLIKMITTSAINTASHLASCGVLCSAMLLLEVKMQVCNWLLPRGALQCCVIHSCRPQRC